MKYCSVCKTYNPDGVQKCPICGEDLITANHARKDIVQAEYHVQDKTRPYLLGRKVTWLLSAILLVVMLIVSATTGKWSYIAVAGLALAMAWLLVFRFLFYRNELKRIYFFVGSAICFFSVLICGHLDAVAHGGYLYIAVSYIMPLAMIAMFIVALATAVIKNKLQYYWFALLAVCFFMIAMLPINAVLTARCGELKYTFVPSLISCIFGLAFTIYALIKHRALTIDELKKRFFIFHN